jgi:alpha-D-xyloside xylohydrolase
MKQANRYSYDMLDFDSPDAARDEVWQAAMPADVREENGQAILDVPFKMCFRNDKGLTPVDNGIPQIHPLHVRAYGSDIIRVTAAFDGDLPGDASDMLEWHRSLKAEPLSVKADETGWTISDRKGSVRMRVSTAQPVVKKWKSTDPEPRPYEGFEATVFPDGSTAVPFMGADCFGPYNRDSLPMGFVTRDGKPQRTVFSLYAKPNECFAGTGERFAKMDLSGRTFILENQDATGVNNRRCYKNMPFFVTSRPYGLMLHSSSAIRLSLADISGRAAQGLVEEPVLDMFFIGGGTLERIVYNFRRITGFPRNVPVWSYGMWMSRMTYFSEKEVRNVAERFRKEKFPCDVLHIDTGWFDKDWVCDWEFSKERFPDPAKFLGDLKKEGFHVSLWQFPGLNVGNRLLPDAIANRYISQPKTIRKLDSAFTKEQYGGPIDFSNPEAVKWYQGMLEKLFKLGAAVIKTDFGEEIDMNADYVGMPASQLRNRYGLLYQKAAFEITEKITGEGIIWARAGWLGCQRYPLHWGGDSVCTWDGLAGDIRGGLHIGLSGYAFWSHDIPGFHGSPDFMNSWPADDLYVRWTQVGTFTSHMRFHGTTPREPYEYPAIADVVRNWLRLRYALIPYIVEQGTKATETGLPVFRALVFHHERDPACWQIDDEYYFGDNLLIAPVLNSEGKRDVYLPEGTWRDFWTGKQIKGPVLLKDVKSPLERIPVYAVAGSTIPVYPLPVQCTGEMDMKKVRKLKFDATYAGLSRSIIGKLVGL